MTAGSISQHVISYERVNSPIRTILEWKDTLIFIIKDGKEDFTRVSAA
jgi:hypothetical protein